MTIGMALVACFALLFAAVKTEVRMYVHQKGDAWNTTVNSVDSVKFRDDEVDGKTVERIHVFRKGEASAWSAATENVDSIDFRLDTLRYTRLYYNCDTLFAKVENCTYDSVVKMTKPTRVSTAEYNYYFKDWSINESKIEEKILVYTAVYDSFLTKKNGAIRAFAYKISDTDSVYFSQGNLQLFATKGTHTVLDSESEVTGIWRFAENQWDVLGEDNQYIGYGATELDFIDLFRTDLGWIDLFGWGTSGWNSGANAYLPVSSSEEDKDYYPGGSADNNLTGDYAKADWGVYNAISNGDNNPNRWRTLTTDEWQYLFNKNKWTLGKVEGRLCFMFVPNSFTEPDGIDVTVISDSLDLSQRVEVSESSYAGNIYNAEQFRELENLGVVALPCAGLRKGTSVDLLESRGFFYWSSTAYDADDAYGFYLLQDGELNAAGLSMRSIGNSVRLVRNTNFNIRFVNPDGTVLLDTILAEGVIPDYAGIPTMDSTKFYTFRFSKWDKQFVAVESDMVYTAMYDSFSVYYTSIFKDYNDTLLGTIEKCTYDSVLAEKPKRPSIQDYDFELLEWKRDESKILSDTLIYTAVYKMVYTGGKSGAIQAACYKVSETDSVYFSRGNLQFCAGNGTGHKTLDGTAQGTWRFADNQYDVIGEANNNVSSTYDGWVDLFFWGTSGWNGGLDVYQPWDQLWTHEENVPEDYYFFIDIDYTKVDWGGYNAISNGGNEPSKWRTLSLNEWKYLIQNNRWTLGYIKTTEVDSILCYLLIPADFTAPSDVNVTVISDDIDLSNGYVEGISESSYAGNTYTIDQFNELEKLGVVVLPSAGECNRHTVSEVGSKGYYWSSSAWDRYSYYFCFNKEGVRAIDRYSEFYGISVRLVKNTDLDIRFVNADGTILLDTTVARGTTPTYTRATPTMDSTKVYTFTFKRWNKDIVAAKSDMVYTAVYDSTPVLYTSVFKDYDGTTIETIRECAYDSVTKNEPTRARTEVYKYDFNSWSLDESKIARDTLIYTAVYDSTEHGMLTYASFKVSDTTSVYFSKGNLQFNVIQGTHKTADSTAKGTWRFAENQWDVVGDGNKSIAEDYDGWIDLFGWGTSGWKSEANAYQPWSKSEIYSDYYPGGSYSNSLTGTYANADWGVYNAISNGGNEPNKWRTLTTSEWQYLFKNNKWTLGYIKTTDKDSSLCFMLIPETFTAPEGTTVQILGTANLTSTSMSSLTVPSTNKYTTDEFASLEQLGVVALPCGGRRGGTSVSYVGSYGYYWSSSANGSSRACGFYFYSTYVDSYDYGGRYYGRSVRLVQNVK